VTGSPILSYSRVTPELYVGPQFKMSGKRRLERAGIHYCVNMRVEFDDAEHGLDLANYCHLPTVDDTPPSMEDMDKGVAFITDAVGNGGKVYIHCSAGVGRAPTMAVAYLLSKGHTLDEAVSMIKRVRPFINIMAPQMELLLKIEAGLGEAK
jgi:protein-tyrosine phosphatase